MWTKPCGSLHHVLQPHDSVDTGRETWVAGQCRRPLWRLRQKACCWHGRLRWLQFQLQQLCCDHSRRRELQVLISVTLQWPSPAARKTSGFSFLQSECAPSDCDGSKRNIKPRKKMFEIEDDAGGADEIRTHDLCSAIAALSHLSYSPSVRFFRDRPGACQRKSPLRRRLAGGGGGGLSLAHHHGSSRCKRFLM